MKPARFEYHRPRGLPEAVELLASLPEAKLLAGGQSLIPMMNFRLARPQHLVDLTEVQELAYVRRDDSHLEIGAMTRQASVERGDGPARDCPVLAAAVQHIGHYAIRTRGTVGGSLAHADPSSELPVLTVALDAELVVLGRAGRRSVAATRFFLGPMTVALEPDEILTAVRLPSVAPTAGWAFVELSRRHGDFAIVCVCAVLELDAAGCCTAARVALGGVAGTPIRSRLAEAALVGERITGARLDVAAASVRGEVDPATDAHASAAYRRDMARLFTRQALQTAWQRAQEAQQ